MKVVLNSLEDVTQQHYETNKIIQVMSIRDQNGQETVNTRIGAYFVKT